MDYKEELRKKLPELKKIEGFPIGNDDDILKLSHLPYYTPCPNPFIKDFIKANGSEYIESADNYSREPYVADVSEGKTDPIYMAHTYHTKVPYKAIMNYIEHYTDEGDIVLDAFSGSGMTGVAAQFSNRKAILSDLAPIGSFIGYNLSSDIDILDAFNEAQEVLKEAKSVLKGYYTTKHEDNTECEINYIIWSDVLECNYCGAEYIFWDEAVIDNSIVGSFPCPHCKAEINKSNSSRAKHTYFDRALQKDIETAKQVPVLINYNYKKKRLSKRPTGEDIKKIEDIDTRDVEFWFPITAIPDGDKTSEPIRTHNYRHVHQYFTSRNLHAISAIFSLADQSKYPNFIKFLLTSFLVKTGSKLHNIGMKNGKINLAGAMPNTLFIPSVFAERNIFTLAEGKLKDIVNAFSSKKNFKAGNVFTQVSSVTDLSTIPSNSIDYIFTDPPFGGNLMYSELSFIWESWLGVRTNNNPEAIINNQQSKKLDDYNVLMLNGFKEYYRVLKPKRWITVEFHNSKSSVWNAIQEALSKAGFIVAQVTILDKKQGTYNQMTATGSVKSDLAISAFKPSESFENQFLKESGEGLEVSFVEEFLSNQPNRPVIERTEKMLYSKMLAYYIQRSYEIRYDAKSFYSLLKNHFIEEDGFWFTSDQINSYIEYKKYAKLNEIEEIKSGGLFLFVTDEKSALVWLHNFLNQPKSFSDVSVAFNQLANIQDDQVPELRNLLEENFVFEGGLYRRPKSEEEHNQITEKRQKQLWKQFESILIQAQTERKKIKEVRKEALTYGFERCYKDKRFKDILTIASKLHPSILENNGELADFVEAAEIQTEGLA